MNLDTEAGCADCTAEVAGELARIAAPETDIYRQRLIGLAEWLEAGAANRGTVTGFDMRQTFADRECGTVCCIGGAAALFYSGHETPHDYFRWRVSNFACDGLYIGQRELGLTDQQAAALFAPRNFEYRKGGYNAAWAARTIRHFLATGNVDWDITKGE
jgi:hypothetical protein